MSTIEPIADHTDIGIHSDSIFIKQQNYFRKLPFCNFLFAEASGSYCCIYLTSGAKLTVSYPLSEVEKHLPQEKFVRTHRSFIINIDHVDSYIGNMLCIGQHLVPIGRSYRKGALARFNILGGG